MFSPERTFVKDEMPIQPGLDVPAPIREEKSVPLVDIAASLEG